MVAGGQVGRWVGTRLDISEGFVGSSGVLFDLVRVWIVQKWSPKAPRADRRYPLPGYVPEAKQTGTCLPTTFLAAFLYRVSRLCPMGVNMSTKSFLDISGFLEEAESGKLKSIFNYLDVCRVVRMLFDAVSDNVFQGLPVLASLDILQPFW